MMTGGDLDVSPGIRRGYPATFHMDLLPQARQRGIGSTMVGTMLDELRRRRVPGIHAQTLSVNQAVSKALRGRDSPWLGRADEGISALESGSD